MVISVRPRAVAMPRSYPSARFEDHDRQFPGRVRLVLVERRRPTDEPRPQPGLLFRRRGSGADGALLADDLHGCVWPCLQVLPPGRIRGGAGVRGDDDEVWAFLDVIDRVPAGLAGGTAGRNDEQCPETLPGWSNGPDPPACQPIDAPVNGPQQPKHPAGRD